jgi:hypothetical protein
MSERVSPVARIVSLTIVGVCFAAVVVAASPALRDSVLKMFGIVEGNANTATQPTESAELIVGANGAPGLKLTQPAVDGLTLKPVPAVLATSIGCSMSAPGSTASSWK